MAKTHEDLSTRQKLLAVAERLLLESGYDAVSVRAINAAAEMNPAAVHYHFGSKEALVAALLEDRLAPLWQRQLDELAERRRHGRTPTPAELVDAVVDPLAELIADPIGQLRLHLLARVVLSRHEMPWTARWFTLEPWDALLCAARPELDATEAAHRWWLTFSLILQHVGDPYAATPRPPRLPLETVKAFAAAGLAAA